MSGFGAPSLNPEQAPSGLESKCFAVVASSWYEEVTDGLVAGAVDLLRALGARVWVQRVPGAFELPLAAKWALERDFDGQRADGVVALGAVIRGGTPHFEYVCQAATQGLTEVALSTGRPVGFGVLTCDTLDEARDRAGLPGSAENKGREAAQAVAAMTVAGGQWHREINHRG
jgi:6,7-dimethyl-8-ribityllumazine synthase